MSTSPEAVSPRIGSRETHTSLQRRMKRLLDLVICIGLGLLVSPLIAAAALAVAASDGRPILFRQTRLGVGRRPFVMYKFRTMRNNGSDIAARDLVRRELLDPAVVPPDGSIAFKVFDSRVTRVGRVLRASSIDELPQLLNVLRGEMSIVGPRPVLEWESELFNPNVVARFDVLPGITGSWQVGGRNRLTMRQMLELDVDYVRTWSLKNDLLIMLKTPAAILRRDGAQ